MTPDRFAARHRWDRGFYPGFVAVGWLAVIMGFAGSVQGRIEGKADYPAPFILQFHVVVFVAWMALLTVQVLLVGRGRQDLHRRLGLAWLVLFPLMLFSGIGAEVFSQRFYSPRYPDNLKFFILPLAGMLLFAGFAGAAFALRRAPAAHKRLMLMATSMILFAAFNRWWPETIYQAMGDGFWGVFIRTFAGPNLLIALAMAYDLATRRRLHPVFLVAVPPMLAAQLLAAAIYNDPLWPPIARRLIGL